MTERERIVYMKSFWYRDPDVSKLDVWRDVVEMRRDDERIVWVVEISATRQAFIPQEVVESEIRRKFHGAGDMNGFISGVLFDVSNRRELLVDGPQRVPCLKLVHSLPRKKSDVDDNDHTPEQRFLPEC